MSNAPLIPPAPLVLRLPVIRHVRTLWHAWHVTRHEQVYRSLGMIPGDGDWAVLRQMWRGIV